jgi:hypothetical protein
MAGERGEETRGVPVWQITIETGDSMIAQPSLGAGPRPLPGAPQQYHALWAWLFIGCVCQKPLESNYFNMVTDVTVFKDDLSKYRLRFKITEIEKSKDGYVKDSVVLPDITNELSKTESVLSLTNSSLTYTPSPLGANSGMELRFRIVETNSDAVVIYNFKYVDQLRSRRVENSGSIDMSK